MSKKSKEFDKEDIKKSSIKDLMHKIEHYKRELFNLRCRKAVSNEAPMHRFKIVRKNIARINTFINIKKSEEITKEGKNA